MTLIWIGWQPGFSSQDVGNGALYEGRLTLLFSLSHPRLCRCRRFESKRQEDANIPTRVLRFLFSTHKHMVGCCCSISTNAGQGPWWCFRIKSNLGFPRLASATVQSRRLSAPGETSPFFRVHHQGGPERFYFKKWEMLTVEVNFART